MHKNVEFTQEDRIFHLEYCDYHYKGDGSGRGHAYSSVMGDDGRGWSDTYAPRNHTAEHSEYFDCQNATGEGRGTGTWAESPYGTHDRKGWKDHEDKDGQGWGCVALEDFDLYSRPGIAREIHAYNRGVPACEVDLERLADPNLEVYSASDTPAVESYLEAIQRAW